MLQAQGIDMKDIQDVRDMMEGTEMGAKKRTCGLCDRDYPIIELFQHRDFKGIEICEGCLQAIEKIYQYGVNTDDEFIRHEEYVDYRIEGGQMCPGSWFARLLELKEEAITMEGIYTG